MMNDKRFHTLSTPDADKRKAKSFNNPFYYTPSPLAQQAAELLQASLPTLSEGKMFGVLIVEKDGQTGYLQAYSGQLEGMNEEAFVPPIFDYLQPEGYFKTKEKEISLINQKINDISSSDEYRRARKELESLRNEAEEAIREKKNAMTVAKLLRDKRRKEAFISEAENNEMTRQSQFLKAEVQRTKRKYAKLVEHAAERVEVFESQMASLRTSRKLKSDRLQGWLFDQFMLRNANGDTKRLIDIFSEYYQRRGAAQALSIPPSGTSECCEPKLLQYAYQHNMKPKSLAMFWWGPSPKTEIRKHRHFYPACNGKCKPILTWMLQGLDVASNPLEADIHLPLEIIYEDNDLAVVSKPEGMLTVPGRSQRESVESILRQRWQLFDTPIVVHRLDMATSGILVVARNQATYHHLQRQFASRTVVKRYVALLPVSVMGRAMPKEGTLSLPLRPDSLDRPRQVVDFSSGKSATTNYRIVGQVELPQSQPTKAVKVELYPVTGRTHQLRVHCAHPQGLDCPIIGDTLYGQRADRLYLHAESIEFTHPSTGKRLKFEAKLW